jgi:uncharacterized protein (TIGR02118 family)
VYRVVVSYAHPEDQQAFLEHYRTVHAPLAKTMPGLVGYSWGVAEMPDGATPEHFLVAALDWPSKDVALQSLGSPEGQAGMADLANFAQAGVSMVAYDGETVV